MSILGLMSLIFLYLECYICPNNFKLSIIITDTVRYNVKSVDTQ